MTDDHPFINPDQFAKPDINIGPEDIEVQPPPIGARIPRERW